MDSVREEELTPQVAASKIQKLWRSYTNRKIYKYYKDIILFKCKGNPSRLLKAINPLEAQLLEASTRVHLRFRLGGENFPPNIYYKIFTHGALVDLNSFAPRDYSVIKRGTDEKKIKYEQYVKNKDQYQNQGWYLRIDNNGWRPISHKVFNKTDYVELFSANKIRYYHYKKEKRDEKVQKKKRLNKLRWIQNMYKNARKEEEEQAKEKFQKNGIDQGEGKENQDDFITQQKANQDQQQVQDEFNLTDEQRYLNYEKQFKELYGDPDANDDEDEDDGLNEDERVEKEFLEIPSDFNPLKDPKYIDMDENQFEVEVKELIEWSKNLDYDEYVKDWFQLSTSNASEAFTIRPINQNVTFSTATSNPIGSVNSKKANISNTMKMYV
ncbi:hypothetical protein TTHERM_01193620 (macronuclear) [Tetrahymena thermophila SB210]|uniref:Uncharacterized protein n=1 Tax=Tetrahymena thermophila (strain SB210) TaxID=312017 RepID=Q22AL4_TETTS|nr:hypothetical protein TTHERM_01193620 [Tetrahymena thermophila SB210]EAR82342.2 hypothetical protein TTHERM_01193620 [Tetrahymena thermophila SB210]|eukprot:XP_001030005.2 hypothetical protein TTHERM_01193620 [Tetrahymena thermophila SB210]